MQRGGFKYFTLILFIILAKSVIMVNSDELRKGRLLGHSELVRIKEIFDVVERAPFCIYQIYIDTISENFNKQHEAAIQFILCLEDGDVDAEEPIRSEFDRYLFSIPGIHYHLFENVEKLLKKFSNKTNPKNFLQVKLSTFNGD